jgi:hypothetical protein
MHSMCLFKLSSTQFLERLRLFLFRSTPARPHTLILLQAARLGLGPLFAGAAAGAYGMNTASNSSWGDLWGLVPKSPWDSAGSAARSGGGTDVSTGLRQSVPRNSHGFQLEVVIIHN